MTPLTPVLLTLYLLFYEQGYLIDTPHYPKILLGMVLISALCTGPQIEGSDVMTRQM